MPNTTPSIKYKRIVLKLSGEMLRGNQNSECIDGKILRGICEEVKSVYEAGVQIGLVVGGGNIFRGLNVHHDRGIDRTTGDFMGMMATVINALAFMDCLEKMGVPVRVQSAIPIHTIAEPFILRRAIRHMEKGRIVIFAAGTGHPYFSTDTAAALRASEIGAEAILKATKVDGVYDKDPMKHADAKKYTHLSFNQALEDRISVMDSTAFSLCLDNNVPILVFNLNEPGSIRRIVEGESHLGTLIS
jgi:uridylate kinase